MVPVLGDAALKFPKLLGCRTAPKGLGTVYICDCASCFWLKEYVLRAVRRGNGPLAEPGKYAEELTRSKNKRKRNKRKHHNKGKGGYPAENAKQAQSSKASLPTLSSSEDYTAPSTDCVRGRWARWVHPWDANDIREVESFGLPDGFVSLPDGSVAVAKHHQLVKSKSAYAS